MPDGDAIMSGPRCGWRAALALALASLVALVSGACRDNDVITSSYLTMAEARADGAAARGDIPTGVPEGAHDIRTASDRRSRRRWGLFNFAPPDAQALRAMLQADEASLAGIECDIPGRVEWWPVLLRGTVNAEHAKAAGLQAYRSRQGGLTVVVNWKQGRAYYWGEKEP